MAPVGGLAVATKEKNKLEELENDFDVEISNSFKNPNSLFEDALPSLKLK
jgi:hypothetical protein